MEEVGEGELPDNRGCIQCRIFSGKMSCMGGGPWTWNSTLLAYETGVLDGFLNDVDIGVGANNTYVVFMSLKVFGTISIPSSVLVYIATLGTTRTLPNKKLNYNATHTMDPATLVCMSRHFVKLVPNFDTASLSQAPALR